MVVISLSFYIYIHHKQKNLGAYALLLDYIIRRYPGYI